MDAKPPAVVLDDRIGERYGVMSKDNRQIDEGGGGGVVVRTSCNVLVLT